MSPESYAFWHQRVVEALANADRVGDHHRPSFGLYASAAIDALRPLIGQLDRGEGKPVETPPADAWRDWMCDPPKDREAWIVCARDSWPTPCLMQPFRMAPNMNVWGLRWKPWTGDPVEGLKDVPIDALDWITKRLDRDKRSSHNTGRRSQMGTMV